MDKILSALFEITFSALSSFARCKKINGSGIVEYNHRPFRTLAKVNYTQAHM